MYIFFFYSQKYFLCIKYQNKLIMLIFSTDIVCFAWLRLQDIQISHTSTDTIVLGLKVSDPGNNT